jgi:hypothetical protein
VKISAAFSERFRSTSLDSAEDTGNEQSAGEGNHASVLADVFDFTERGRAIPYDASQEPAELSETTPAG